MIDLFQLQQLSDKSKILHKVPFYLVKKFTLNNVIGQTNDFIVEIILQIIYFLMPAGFVVILFFLICSKKNHF